MSETYPLMRRRTPRPDNLLRSIAEREAAPPVHSATGDDPASENPRAPIRQTLVGELNGLYRFAVARLGRDTHLAEDVVQQALVIALTHHSPPTDTQAQKAWLRGIVHNAIRHSLRSSIRGREAVKNAAFERDSASTRPDAVGHPCEPDPKAQRMHELYLAVTELDQADQDLFYAFYRRGDSHAAIADHLDTTIKGVEARLYRMRSRLRSALERCGARRS